MGKASMVAEMGEECGRTVPVAAVASASALACFIASSSWPRFILRGGSEEGGGAVRESGGGGRMGVFCLDWGRKGRESGDCCERDEAAVGIKIDGVITYSTTGAFFSFLTRRVARWRLFLFLDATFRIGEFVRPWHRGYVHVSHSLRILINHLFYFVVHIICGPIITSTT